MQYIYVPPIKKYLIPQCPNREYYSNNNVDWYDKKINTVINKSEYIPCKNPQNNLIGFEYEFNSKVSIVKIKSRHKKKIFTSTHDASIDHSYGNYGAEVQSIPCTMKELPTQIIKTKRSIQKYINNNTFKHANCGIHIHLDKIGKMDGIVFALLCKKFLVANRRFFKKISKRNSLATHWCKYEINEAYPLSVKYNCVYFNVDSVEFRIFNSTNDVLEILTMCRLIYALYYIDVDWDLYNYIAKLVYLGYYDCINWIWKTAPEYMKSFEKRYGKQERIII